MCSVESVLMEAMGGVFQSMKEVLEREESWGSAQILKITKGILKEATMSALNANNNNIQEIPLPPEGDPPASQTS